MQPHDAPRTELSALERSLRVGVVLLAVGLCAGYSIGFLSDKPNEWNEVFLAAARDLAGGGGIYQHVPSYTYPPFMAWLATPLAHQPVPVARAVWYAVLWVGLIVAVVLGWSLVPGELRRTWWPTGLAWGAFGVGLVLGLRPAMNSLGHQQADLLLGLLLFTGMWQLQRQRPFLGAVSLGIAAAIKCTPLLWVGYLVWKRHWLPALALVVVALGLNILPTLACPPQDGRLHLETWARAVFLPTQSADRYPGAWNVDPLTNQSLAGSLLCWLTTEATEIDGKVVVSHRADAPPPWVVRGVHRVCAVALLGLTLLSVWGRQPRSVADRAAAAPLEYAQVLMLMLLLSPMSHKTHFFTLLLPGFLLGHRALVARSTAAAVVVAVVLVLQIGLLRPLGVAWTHWAHWYGVPMLSSLLLWAGCAHARWSLRTASAREAVGADARHVRAA